MKLMPLIATAILTFTLLGATPGAQAATPRCIDATESPTYEYDGTYIVFHFGGAMGSSTEIWNEANDVDGLQRTTCIDADGRVHPADDLEQRAAPSPSEVPCVPVLPNFSVCIF